MIVRTRAQLEELRGKQAIFALDNGQRLTLAREELEPTAEVGASYIVQVMPESEAQQHHTELAHTLLNQLLDRVDRQSSV